MNLIVMMKINGFKKIFIFFKYFILFIKMIKYKLKVN